MRFLTGILAALLLACVASQGFAAEPDRDSSSQPLLTVIVMDPLAGPLSCPCVEGYAQRKYEVLAAHLEKSMGRPVKLVFAEALETALQKEANGRADLIIGKDSVVRADAKQAKIGLATVARLTGKDGAVTQTGLIVVGKEDPAQSVKDLLGYRVIFGPTECDEKHSAALALLAQAGVPVPAKLETDQACSDGAAKILELGPNSKAAAVISSYAAPLLEGCGTIQKGDLRVIGETKPVPFVTAFTTQSVDAAARARIQKSLLSVNLDPQTLVALESLLGFVEPGEPKIVVSKKKELMAEAWPGWRGPGRDGRAPSLPRQLPEQLNVEWEVPLGGPGLGGIAATNEFVIFGDRDLNDTRDVYRCFDAKLGLPLWTVACDSPGELDYGNTPRATPLIHDRRAYLFGAFGDLLCVELETGQTVWTTNIRRQFGADSELPWGYCASPLIVDERLILNPGAKDASLVALDPHTGKIIWKTPGEAAGYGSFIVARCGDVRQIVGYDAKSLGGWDINTGRRLWRLVPPEDGDFNVPTPIGHRGSLIVATENNGTRIYDFDEHGVIIPEPVAKNLRLSPDMSSPVVVGSRLYCVNRIFYCLGLDDDLAIQWRERDAVLSDYGAVIASADRLLIVGSGELLLADPTQDKCEIVSRLRVFHDRAEIYSHPALVGNRLYIRGETSIRCIRL